MLSRSSQPIIAIATAPGRGAVGIVRISGKNLGPFVQQFLGRSLRAREATYLPFCDASGIPIDQGLALHFPGPHSFTGEDVLELQAHGGPVVLQLLLARCMEVSAQKGDSLNERGCLEGLRIAQPGEFTERAFLNDKIDLAQAEAIADLIDATTEAAARSATQSLSGVFSREIHALRDALIHLRMLVEATLDFPEEEIDFLQKADAQGQLDRLQKTLHTILQKATQGALLREGITVVIAGQPNAGKSSLLNALAGAELAIVTPVAGTGLRNSEDHVEQIGIARAWEAIEAADAVLFLHDLTREDAIDYIAADAHIAGTISEKLSKSVPVIDIWNKVDAANTSSRGGGIMLSAKTGLGLDALRRRLLEVVGWQAASGGVYIARARHVQALRRVEAHLQQAATQLSASIQLLDLLAEELRLGQNALSEITGEFTSDELLGVIFSKFCIGK